MPRLAAAGYELELAPERGGAVIRFDWRGKSLFRAVCGSNIFDVASFPLVPFSNRIANGRFEFEGRSVFLSPNFPGADHPHPLHGFGWLSEWSLIEADQTLATLRFRHERGEWPWCFTATQHFNLGAGGLEMRLLLVNDDDRPMPFGLGFHPYFPRDDDTLYLGFHRAEWQTSDDGLPLRLKQMKTGHDWWDRKPVGTRAVDTVYAEREGALHILWPSRGHSITILPSGNLDHSVIYTPAGADFFCVEPVSQRTDAFNRRPGEPLLPVLAPGAQATVNVRIRAEKIS